MPSGVGASSRLGLGLGLRSPHYSFIAENQPKVGWFEAISENFIGIEGGTGGRPLAWLERFRADYPVVLHGVSLSIGSVDPLDRDYLAKLKTLYHRVEPEWVSDHVCWTGAHGENLHDLLPLPYTEEALTHVVSRVQQVQEVLGRRLALENVSAYVAFAHSEMTEWEFLSELSRRADCHLLLDVNNVYVSSRNQGFDAQVFIDSIPVDRVVQFHLAGHSYQDDLIIDTHDHPVCDAVWELYEKAVKRFGPIPTLIEWDDEIPEFPVLLAEGEKARKILEAGCSR